MNAIVAVDNNWCIGNDNNLLFHIKHDLKRFKEFTSNNVVVMGKNTFNSLPIKPLPNRVNIVLTHDKNFAYPNVLTINNIEDVGKIFKKRKVFIIGGESIYNQFLKYCNIIHVTKIFANGNGNKFFPNLDEDKNFKIKNKLYVMEENNLKYQYFTYERISSKKVNK